MNEQPGIERWEETMKTNAGTWPARLLALTVVYGLALGGLSAVGEAQAASADQKKRKPGLPVKYIIKDGLPLGRLYLPATFGRATQFAAQELRGHLKKMTGADFEMSWRNFKKPRDSGFVLEMRPESEWKGKESAQAFVIEESDSPLPVVTITGNSNLAVLYGVYEYLGGLGVRWLTPGDIGTNSVKVGSQPEPRDWDKSFAMDVTEQIKAGEENVLAVHGYDSGGAEGVWRPSALYTD